MTEKQERRWGVDYNVYFKDGTEELRTWYMNAPHMAAVVERAENYIEAKAKTDREIMATLLRCVCLEE